MPIKTSESSTANSGAFKAFYNIYNLLMAITYIAIMLIYIFRGKYKIFQKRIFNKIRTKPGRKQYIWIHASSVGEGIIAFQMVRELKQLYPDLAIVVTTTSLLSTPLWHNEFKAEIANGYIEHHLLPLDHKVVVDRFLNYYTPKFVLWIESDFWPNYLLALRKYKIPAILLNGRISKRTFRRYYRLKSFIAAVLNAFNVIIADSTASRERFSYFAKFYQQKNPATQPQKVEYYGNFKYANTNPQLNTTESSIIQLGINNRPKVLGLSTHSPEEEMLAQLHQNLKAKHPNLLTVILPRHTERVDDIIKGLKSKELKIQRFSQGLVIQPDTDIYIVDALGKVFLFSSLIKIVYMGKSMFAEAKGGHNLLEPMRMGAAVVFGPYMYNFVEIIREAMKNKAVLQVKDPVELYNTFDTLLNKPQEAEKIGAAAQVLVNQQTLIRQKTMEIISSYLTTAEVKGD